MWFCIQLCRESRVLKMRFIVGVVCVQLQPQMTAVSCAKPLLFVCFFILFQSRTEQEKEKEKERMNQRSSFHFRLLLFEEDLFPSRREL